MTRTADFQRRGRRADCRPGGRSRPRAGLSRHHRSGEPSATGIRRFRSISGAFGPSTRSTGSSTGRRPKAFVPLEVGQALWRSRYGDRTSVRSAPADGESAGRRAATVSRRGCATTIDPLAMGLSVRDVRGEGLAASRGATDFGEYFTYFSFFLVVVGAAAGGAVLQARRRAARARGRPAARRRLLDARASGGCSRPKGSCWRSPAASIGAAGAVAYAGAMMAGLRTWWVGAVGTTSLTPARLAALARRRRRRRARRGDGLHLVDAARAGEAVGAEPAGGRDWSRIGIGRSGLRTTRSGGRSLVRLRSRFALARRRADGRERRRRDRPDRRVLRRRQRRCSSRACASRRDRCGGRRASLIDGRGWRAVSRLGLRNAADRPGRSVLAIAVIASATFILISVDAFRRDGAVGDRSALGRRRLSAARRPAAADRQRSEQPRGPRGDRPRRHRSG